MSVSTQDSVLFCPLCNCPTIDVSALIGGAASCRNCHWHGKREDCIVKEIQHEFANQEEVFRTFSRDVQLLVAEFGAVPIGRMLRKWGFMPDGPDGKPDTKVLTRYVRAIARGIAEAVVKERETVEKEDGLRGKTEFVAHLDEANLFPSKVVGRG